MKIADRPNNADPLSNSYKRQNIYSLKKNFNQQKLDEFLSKNDNEESVNFANKLNFLKRDENEREKTNASNNKKLLRNNSFRAAIGELQIQQQHHEEKRCSLTRSATNEFSSSSVQDFNFKIPKSVQNPTCHLSKSNSMNFSILTNNNENTNKKRKLSSNSSNSINSRSKSSFVRENKSRKILDKHMSTYSSLRNLNSFESFSSDSMTRSHFSLEELSSFIKCNLSKSNCMDMDKEKKSESRKKVETESIDDTLLNNVLSVEIDSEIFHFVLNSFRLCSLMLPKYFRLMIRESSIYCLDS